MQAHDWRDGVLVAGMSDLIGRTLTAISKTDDSLTLTDAEGAFTFFHRQDCCESVYIESVVGDLEDLIGSPILLAEEVVHDGENPEGVEAPEYQDSFTWTFYKFATRKGYVDVRFYGGSNGYYSERVDIEFTRHAGEPEVV